MRVLLAPVPPRRFPLGPTLGTPGSKRGRCEGAGVYPACNKRHLSSPRVKPRGGADPYRRGPGDHKPGAAGRHPLRGATRMPPGERGCSERPESRRAARGLAAPLPAREKGALGPSVVPGCRGGGVTAAVPSTVGHGGCGNGMARTGPRGGFQWQAQRAEAGPRFTPAVCPVKNGSVLSRRPSLPGTR